MSEASEGGRAAPHGWERVLRTLLISDLVGSTARVERLGDVEAAEIFWLRRPSMGWSLVWLAMVLAGHLLGCAPEAAYPLPTPPFIVAPYLVAGDGLWLKWEAAHPAPTFQVQILSHGEPRWILSPERDVRYYAVQLPMTCQGPEPYEIQVTGMPAPQQVTLPPCPSAPQVAFAFLTDTQGDANRVHAFAKQIARSSAQFVLHGGDLVNLGSRKADWVDYHAATQVFAGHLATVATLGNHESYWDDTYAYYQRYIGPGVQPYRFSSDPVDVLVLNSEDLGDDAFDGAQRLWLEQELRRLTRAPGAERRWRIVLTHHSPHSTSMANAWFLPSERGTKLRTDYVPLFERYGVRLVLSGHTHVYERSEHHGIHYVVGGPAGGVIGIPGASNPHSVLYLREPTYSMLVANSQEFSLATHGADGELLDRLLIRR